MHLYWSELRRHPGFVFVQIIFISLGELTTAVAFPWFIKLFIDTLSSGSNVQDGAVAGRLLQLLGIIFALRVGAFIFFRIGYLSIQHSTSQIMADLSRSSFSYLLRHSYTFFTNTFAGTLVRRINRFSQAFDQLWDIVVFQLIPFVLTLAGIEIILFSRSRLIGSLVLIWIVVYMVINQRVAVWRLKFNEARAEKDSEATGILSDSIGNALSVKLFSGYPEEESLFWRASEALRKARKLSWNMSEISDSAQSGLIILIEILVIFYAIKLWQAGQLTIGDFVLFQGYLFAITEKLHGFTRMLRNVYESVADAKEMVDLLQLPHEIRDKRHAKPLVVSRGKIELRDVVFRYHARQPVLDHYSLTIKPGERIALVGSSGAGKSTVIKLLFRFHDINAGKILIDGQSIADVTQDSLRDAIALVPQEPVLFHRTLMDNIRYGRRDAADEEVIEAAKQAHCHEFISNLPEGYGTFVGERGIKLSGGERQRVAIARAILKNAPILVLDEATSSLDSESEALIQDALHGLMKEKTVIVIAHRLSTIMQMDRIIVMKDGKVVDEGTHEGLLKKVGIYQQLWNIQAGGFLAG